MRLGAKKRPFYRLIVIDKRKPRESKAKEIIGYYDPLQEPAEIMIDMERAKVWDGQYPQWYMGRDLGVSGAPDVDLLLQAPAPVEQPAVAP